MFNLKRSVAALPVMAGLLAAAAPASAQIGPATVGLTTPHTGPGPQVATSEVFELNTFGGNDTLRADSNEAAVEGLGVVTNNNDPDTMGLIDKTMAEDSYGVARNGIASSEVFEFKTFAGNELAAKGFKRDGNELPVTSLKADSNEVAVEGFKLANEPRKGVQSREPTHGITMLDYDGTP
jgi:hypothetical protein